MSEKLIETYKILDLQKVNTLDTKDFIICNKENTSVQINLNEFIKIIMKEGKTPRQKIYDIDIARSKIFSGFKNSWVKVFKWEKSITSASSITFQISSGEYNKEKIIYKINVGNTTAGQLSINTKSNRLGCTPDNTLWLYCPAGEHTSLRVLEMGDDINLLKIVDTLPENGNHSEVFEEPEGLKYNI